MPISSRVGLTHPESWHKVSEQGYLGLFFYRVRKKGSFEVLLVFFSTFSSQNLKYPTLMHWLASWVNPTSKTHIPCLPTTSQVSPVQFSLDSVALNFRPIWCHGPSLKHCVPNSSPTYGAPSMTLYVLFEFDLNSFLLSFGRNGHKTIIATAIISN